MEVIVCVCAEWVSETIEMIVDMVSVITLDKADVIYVRIHPHPQEWSEISCTVSSFPSLPFPPSVTQSPAISVPHSV